MSFLTYFLIAYGIILTISICVFVYELKHALNIDPDECFGDTILDSGDNKKKLKKIKK